MLVSNLLARHGSSLDPADHHSLAHIEARARVRKDFALPAHLDPETQRAGFIQIERVFASDPVTLFGQATPSLAHSRITLFRAKRTETGDFKPAEILLSALISEKALTDLIFAQNRGHAATPATATRLGDTDLPPWEDKGEAPEELLAQMVEKDRDEIKVMLDGLRKDIASLKGHPKIETRRALAIFLDKLSADGNLRFCLERHMENLVARKTDFVVEAAHLALHSEKVAAAFQQIPRLTAPQAFDPDRLRADNPMLDAVLGFFTPEEEEAALAALRLEVESLVTEHDLAATIFRSPDGRFQVPRRILPHQAGPDIRKQVERLFDLWNAVSNPHVLAARRKLTPQAMGLGLSQIHGWTGFLHSSMPVSESSYFTLRLCAAFEEVDFGQRKIRGEHMPVLEVALGAEDMMTALRGHPTGRPVPCTLKSVAGTRLSQIDTASQHEELELDAADAQVAASGTAAELAQHGREIASLFDSGRSGKAWKEEISARLDAIADTLRRHDETIRTALDASEARISGQVDSLARAELDEIRSHIDPRHLALLGHGTLTRQIPKDSKPRD